LVIFYAFGSYTTPAPITTTTTPAPTVYTVSGLMGGSVNAAAGGLISAQSGNASGASDGLYSYVPFGAHDTSGFGHSVGFNLDPVYIPLTYLGTITLAIRARCIPGYNTGKVVRVELFNPSTGVYWGVSKNISIPYDFDTPIIITITAADMVGSSNYPLSQIAVPVTNKFSMQVYYNRTSTNLAGDSSTDVYAVQVDNYELGLVLPIM